MAESGTRQPEAGDEIFRSGPDDLLVKDDGLPLRIRRHSGQHARKLPRRIPDHKPAGRILEVMKATPAATRRFLPTSPFKPPPPAPPAEQFAVQDQVTHDKYGLGRVMSIEDDTILVIDFGTQKLRITTPCAKLTKL